MTILYCNYGVFLKICAHTKVLREKFHNSLSMNIEKLHSWYCNGSKYSELTYHISEYSNPLTSMQLADVLANCALGWRTKNVWAIGSVDETKDIWTTRIRLVNSAGHQDSTWHSPNQRAATSAKNIMQQRNPHFKKTLIFISLIITGHAHGDNKLSLSFLASYTKQALSLYLDYINRLLYIIVIIFTHIL